MTRRENVVTFQGNPMTLLGDEVKVGDKAPHFKLVGTDLSEITCDTYHGKVRVLSVVPSIDTGVCATQTRTFNEKASGLSDDVTILTVSRDLPFAQGRFCGAEGIDQVVMGSDYKFRDFGEAYGVLIEELELLTRAVFVLDREDKIAYVQIVPEITDEPDYDAVLEVVKGLL